MCGFVVPAVSFDVLDMMGEDVQEEFRIRGRSLSTPEAMAKMGDSNDQGMYKYGSVLEFKERNEPQQHPGTMNGRGELDTGATERVTMLEMLFGGNKQQL
jgi:hypothetical protein